VDAWLYIVLLGAAIWGCAWILPKTAAIPSAPTDLMKEIEDAMDHFSAEMEEENKQVMNLVTSMKTDHAVQVRTLMERIQYLESHSRGLTEKVSELAGAMPVSSHHQTIQQNPLTSVPAESVSESVILAEELIQPPGLQIRKRYSELFQLAEQGKSIDYIAKKLGMNKGEVMLIMQLSKQEERARA
jgi:predicted Zn-dependent protease with MMP-like domain